MNDADVFSSRDIPGVSLAGAGFAGSGLWRRFGEALRAEAAYQAARLFVWMPIFMAVGIVFYFSLPFEPPIVSGFLAGVPAAILLIFLRKRPVPRVLLLAALCVCTGFAAASVRTARIHTPILSREMAPVRVEGTIESLEPLEEGKGFRGILRDVRIERLAPEETPRKLRLKLRPGPVLAPGQRIEVLAGLNPPGAPSLPGGFDFRRHLYFQGIGGVGFAYGKALILAEPERSGFGDFIERIRLWVGERISAAMPAREAAVANALMTGPRAAIDEEDNEAIRDAGLAHMLSISGLHIGLFFGVVFFAVRFFLSCFPALALRYPIKKVAAAAAMTGAIFYTLISGNTVPTQRSILMAGIVFLAILLDRSPLSIRLVAFSALCILLVAPESVLGASFQMSFSAVAALAVFYESVQLRRFATLPGPRGPVRRFLSYFIGIAMTSLVATFATAPFTLYHFQQLPIFGVVANMLAIPVLGFVVMPAAVAAFLLMPLGLEWLVMPFIDWGVDIILAIAHRVAAFDHAVVTVSLWPGISLALFSFSFVLFLLLNWRMKLLGLVPLMLFFFFVFNEKQPDVLVSSDGSLVAIKGHEPILMISDLRKERFTRKNWVRALGMDEDSARKWPVEGMLDDLSCGEEGCRLSRNGVKIAFLRKRDIFAEECAWADVLIAPFSLPPCRDGIVIDRKASASRGPYALYLEDALRIEDSLEGRAGRPWF